MRLIAALALAAAAGLALWLWQAGALQALAWWAAQTQRGLQDGLAARIADLRAGDPTALRALVLLCAGYGFVHAVGPGHGKVLIGGAALGTGATALRLAAIAVAGSLARAALAVLLVYGGFVVFEATARAKVATTEAWIEPAGYAALALVGLWLAARGLRAWPAPSHPHAHGHDDACGCGHHHAPAPEAVAAATGPGATLALVGAMALRPCTGALVVLAIAWQMDVAAAGAAGVVAMGLGTAAFTVLVALLAVLGRDAALFSAGGGLARHLAPSLQVAAGAAVALVGAGLLAATLRG